MMKAHFNEITPSCSQEMGNKSSYVITHRDQEIFFQVWGVDRVWKPFKTFLEFTFSKQRFREIMLIFEDVVSPKSCLHEINGFINAQSSFTTSDFSFFQICLLLAKWYKYIVKLISHENLG